MMSERPGCGSGPAILTHTMPATNLASGLLAPTVTLNGGALSTGGPPKVLVSKARKESEKHRSKTNRDQFKSIIDELNSCLGDTKMSTNKCLSTAISVIKLGKFFNCKSLGAGSDDDESSSPVEDLPLEELHSEIPMDVFMSTANWIGIGFVETGKILYVSQGFKDCFKFDECIIGCQLQTICFNADEVLREVFIEDKLSFLFHVKSSHRREKKVISIYIDGKLMEADDSVKMFLGYGYGRAKMESHDDVIIKNPMFLYSGCETWMSSEYQVIQGHPYLDMLLNQEAGSSSSVDVFAYLHPDDIITLQKTQRMIGEEGYSRGVCRVLTREKVRRYLYLAFKAYAYIKVDNDEQLEHFYVCYVWPFAYSNDAQSYIDGGMQFINSNKLWDSKTPSFFKKPHNKPDLKSFTSTEKKMQGFKRKAFDTYPLSVKSIKHSVTEKGKVPRISKDHSKIPLNILPHPTPQFPPSMIKANNNLLKVNSEMLKDTVLTKYNQDILKANTMLNSDMLKANNMLNSSILNSDMLKANNMNEMLNGSNISMAELMKANGMSDLMKAGNMQDTLKSHNMADMLKVNHVNDLMKVNNQLLNNNTLLGVEAEFAKYNQETIKQELIKELSITVLDLSKTVNQTIAPPTFEPVRKPTVFKPFVISEPISFAPVFNNMEAGPSQQQIEHEQQLAQFQAQQLQKLQHSPPPQMNHFPPLTMQHSPPLQINHSPPLTMQHSPPLTMQHSPPLQINHSPPLTMQHSPPLQINHSPPPQMHHSPPLTMQHSPPLQMNHSPPLTMQHSPPLQINHSPPPQMNHSPPLTMQHSPPLQMNHSPPLPVPINYSPPLQMNHSPHHSPPPSIPPPEDSIPKGLDSFRSSNPQLYSQLYNTLSKPQSLIKVLEVLQSMNLLHKPP